MLCDAGVEHAGKTELVKGWAAAEPSVLLGLCVLWPYMGSDWLYKLHQFKTSRLHFNCTFLCFFFSFFSPYHPRLVPYCKFICTCFCLPTVRSRHAKKLEGPVASVQQKFKYGNRTGVLSCTCVHEDSSL